MKDDHTYTTFEQLVIVAPGKETLKGFNTWLTTQKLDGLSLEEDIFPTLTKETIPDEIRHLLTHIRSHP